MSTSGNGPTVINIASTSYQPDEIDPEASVSEEGKKGLKRSLQNLRKNLPQRQHESRKDKQSNGSKKSGKPVVDDTKKKLTFQEKLPYWAREAKPVGDPLQLMLWWIYVGLRLHRSKMHPPKEVSFFRVSKVTAAIMTAINLVREETAAIIGVIAIKGGVGKTTISTWFVAAMAWATKLSAAIIDTDRGGGLVASRFALNKVKMSNGQIKRPMSIYELGKRIEEGEVFTQEKLIAETVSDSHTGVMIFRAPPGTGVSFSRTGNMLRHVRSQYAGGLVVDTTPGLRVPMTNATAVTSDVKIVVAQGISDESIRGVRTALNFGPYELRQSIETVLVVIVALPVRKCSKRTAYELVNHYNLRPVRANERGFHPAGEDDDPEDAMVPVAEGESLRQSQIMFLPEDRYMDTHRVQELGPVVFEAVRPRTKLALAQLVKAKDDIMLELKRKTPLAQQSLEGHPPTDQRTIVVDPQRASA